MNHDLKTEPPYWERVADLSKTFEVRTDDRDYQVGDGLLLREWTPGKFSYQGGEYSGGALTARISYIYRGLGLAEGMCVLALTDVIVSWPITESTDA